MRRRERERSGSRRGLAAASLAFLACIATSGALASNRGDLDPRFGDRGRIVHQFGPAGDAAAASLSVLEDDRFVVAGIKGRGHTSGFAVARYLPRGKLDASFSSDGKVVLPAGGFAGNVAVRALPDSRSVIVGDVFPETGTLLARIVRLLADGTPDPGFGSDGAATVAMPEGHYWGDTAIAPDGSAVIATTDGDLLRVTRVGSDGAMDQSFGEGGSRTFDLPGPDLVFGGIALDRAGRTLVSAGAGKTSARTDLFVVRLTAAGGLDPGFDDDGITSADIGRNDFGGDLVTDRRGRVLVADSLNRRQAIVRFRPDGRLDTRFGDEGAYVESRSYGYVSNIGDDPEGVFTQGRKILGFSEAGGRRDDDFLLFRLRPNGTLDRSFSRNGFAFVDFGGIDGPYAGAVQSSGRILLAGYRGAGEPPNPPLSFAIAGFRPNGKR